MAFSAVAVSSASVACALKPAAQSPSSASLSSLSSLRFVSLFRRSGSPLQDAKRLNPIFDLRCSREEEKDASSAAKLFCGVCLAASLFLNAPSLAASNVRLPPLSTDPLRCEKAFVGNTIGQANGVADKLLDLRFCDFSNDSTNLKGKTLSAALMSDAKFDNADLTEVIMSKAYAVGASFRGTIFTNGVLDRVAFDNSDLTGAKFINTVLSGSTFAGANLEGADFEDALIGYVDIQKICRNDTLSPDARLQLGCK